MKLAFFLAEYGSLLDWIINDLSGAFGYSHCELVFSDGMSFSSSLQDGGTRFKKIDYVKDANQWYIIDIPMTPEHEASVRAFCEKENGLKYDWRGAISVVLPFFGHDDTRWFCSEIICAALKVDGAFPKLNPILTPNNLYVRCTDPDVFTN